MEPLQSWACSTLRRAKGQAPRERRKTSRGRTALLALDAELNCQRNCPWSAERESRLKRRNYDMIVFLAGLRVKVNRETLLCKTSGGDGEICEIEEPFSRTGLYVGEEKAAATRFKKEDGEISSCIQAISKITGLKTGNHRNKEKKGQRPVTEPWRRERRGRRCCRPF